MSFKFFILVVFVELIAYALVFSFDWRFGVALILFRVSENLTKRWLG